MLLGISPARNVGNIIILGIQAGPYNKCIK